MLQPFGDVGAGELVVEAAREARELGRLELVLARDELLRDLAAAKTTIILSFVAGALLLLGLSSMVLALGLVLGPLLALMLGIGLLAAAAVIAFVAYRLRPARPMSATARRLGADERLLKEHLS